MQTTHNLQIQAQNLKRQKTWDACDGSVCLMCVGSDLETGTCPMIMLKASLYTPGCGMLTVVGIYKTVRTRNNP